MPAALANRIFIFGMLIVFAFAVVLALRAGETTRYLDEADYDRLGRTLLAEHRYADLDGTPTAYRPPGYPLLLAAIYALDDRRFAARLANAALLACAVGLLGLVAARLVPGAHALVPIGFAAFPLSAYMASLLYPQILSAALVAAVVLLLTGPAPTVRTALLAGLAYGFLCLAVPSFLLLSPAIAIAAGWRAPGESGFRFPRAAAVAAAAILVVAPWTIRNAVVLHAPVPVSTNSGINLLLGNTPATRPDSGVDVPIDAYCPQRPGADEVERDRRCRQCATDWMRSEPGAAAALYLGKLAYWFSPTNSMATGSTPALLDWVLRLTYGPLLLLALARLATFRQRPLARSEVLIYALYLAAAATGALFFSRIRFRVPFDLLLIPVVAAFLLDLARRRWPRTAPAPSAARAIR